MCGNGREVWGKKKKERKTRKETCRCIYACADEKWTSYEIRSRSKKIVKFEAAGCGTRTQIQDEVVLRSKPNFAKVAGALSCRIPFLPGEYRDRCFRVVEHPRCISFPLESSTFPPLFPLFIYLLIVRRSLQRICAGWYQVAGEFKTLVHSFSRRRDRERERDRKIENTHKCTFIRDRGISSSSKIGNQCGFTDGAFVRDRQTRQSTTWYAVGDNAIILCGAQVRWCVAVAGWAVATAAAAAAAVVAFSFLRSSWLPAPKLCLFSFFSFSFSFNPFNPAIIIDISVNRDKSLIAMLSFSFSPHPRTVFEIIDNEYGMEMASFQWQRVRRSIPSREPKFRFNFIFDNRRWQTLRNPNWLICHAYSFELLAIAMAAAAAAAAFIRDHAITNDNNNNNITKRRHVRRLVRLETFDCFDAER